MSVYSGEKPEFFAQSLESLYTQTYPADEIVVVCDGELNEQLDGVLEQYSEKFGGKARRYIALKVTAARQNVLTQGLLFVRMNIL